MAACPKYKIDSNSTGLRYAEEECLKQLPVAADAVAATGTVTFSGVGTAADTITVNGTTLTLVAGSPGAGEVQIGGSAGATATNVAAAINALAPVNAAAAGAVVTVTAAVPGAAGNALTLAKSSTAMTLSGATLAGGADEVIGPQWFALEPNSYADFGGQITTVARNPINQSRQRKKGVVTDIEASGGFQQDLTYFNLLDMLQGFMFADVREKKASNPYNGDRYTIDDVDGAGKVYTFNAAPGGTGFVANQLVLAEGFAIAANNGVKRVTAASSTTVTVAEVLADEGANADAAITVVGYQAAVGTLGIALNGDLVRLTSSGVDLTTLPLTLGEWLYVGGDQTVNTFTNNGGFARISAIDAEYLEFDKVDWPAPVAEPGTGKLINLYFGTVLKNESDPDLIVRRSYHLERTLGKDAVGTMSEYLVGAVPNEFTLNSPQADKITVDLAFIACDHQARTGTQGLLPGDRIGVVEGDAFNTSSDFGRIKMAVVAEDASIDPLFAYAQDLTLTINNNASANKALGVLGALDISVGTFEVGGSLTVYFANAESVQAVRNNADVTLDAILVKNNQGVLYDIPLLSLGNGRLAVEQDQPITIPLETNAAESKFGHTLLWQFFPYLPDAASL